MVVLVALLLPRALPPRQQQAARDQAHQGLVGMLEGDAAMDMAVEGDGGFWRRLLSPEGESAEGANERS